MTKPLPMARNITIALDAMGGDHAPASVVNGAALALKTCPKAHFLFCGDQHQIEPLLAQYPALLAVSQIKHTTTKIPSDAKGSYALRQGDGTSMALAIGAVANAEADCVVSGGNTGALMVLARKMLKTLDGIDRPAIAAPLPTENGQVIVLDLGANIDCTPDMMVQFALMGGIYARAVIGVDQPTIGVLNVGEEAQKGSELVRQTAALLQSLPLPGIYQGFVEGNDITGGKVDVVVTDGFTGNVMLKTTEGTARFIRDLLKKAAKHSLLARIGFLLALPALKALSHKIDPRAYNGAMFLGLGGVCVKSHGGMDAKGVANAIKTAANLVGQGYNQKLAEELQHAVADLKAAHVKVDNAPPEVLA
jgi:glycerol-3-phosphate acyltransferase PlsX